MAPFLSDRRVEGIRDIGDLPVLEPVGDFVRGPERTMTWNTPPLTHQMSRARACKVYTDKKNPWNVRI